MFIPPTRPWVSFLSNLYACGLSWNSLFAAVAAVVLCIITFFCLLSLLLWLVLVVLVVVFLLLLLLLLLLLASTKNDGTHRINPFSFLLLPPVLLRCVFLSLFVVCFRPPPPPSVPRPSLPR